MSIWDQMTEEERRAFYEQTKAIADNIGDFVTGITGVIEATAQGLRNMAEGLDDAAVALHSVDTNDFDIPEEWRS